MTSRVLVADDSLTIQKVIGITLANSGYDLVECLNEAELLKKIQTNHFDLILLDFNLSDSQSGYELSKKINSAMPSAPIIVMLGTFDSVDETQFDECGITDKIVKPFESSKFIKKCRDLLEERKSHSPVAKKDKVKVNEKSMSKSDNIDMWKVDAPVVHSIDKSEISDSMDVAHNGGTLDPLTSEIEGWGFSHGSSLEDKYQKTFPPIIEESTVELVLDSDPLESFEGVDHNATDPSFELPEDLNRNLLNELDHDLSPETFWAVDEVIPRKSEEQSDIAEARLDEVTADLTDSFNAFRESELYLHSDEETPIDQPVLELSSHLNQDEIIEKLKLSLRPMIEEMVKEFCRQSAEKVAWEVIPDLAENLIRQEIKEISDSVQH